MNEFLPLESANELEFLEREENVKRFSATLRRLMRERNVKQSELAKAIYISQQSVSKMTNGKWLPPLTIKERIANFFNVEVETL